MSDFIGLVIVVAVIVFAVYRTFPDDHPLKKAAVVIVGGLAPFWDRIVEAVRGILG